MLKDPAFHPYKCPLGVHGSGILFAARFSGHPELAQMPRNTRIPNLSVNTAAPVSDSNRSGITVSDTGSLRGDGISVSMAGMRIAGDGGGSAVRTRTHVTLLPAHGPTVPPRWHAGGGLLRRGWPQRRGRCGVAQVSRGCLYTGRGELRLRQAGAAPHHAA